MTTRRIQSPVPQDEAARLRALDSLGVLDTASDPVVDGLVRCAAAICGFPIALLSLVDSDRQWFYAQVGLKVRETPRDIAFCAHTIMSDQPLVVPDATKDARFAHNPLVTEAPHLRAYVGVPLQVDGQRLGTLCVADQRVHELSDDQLMHLKDLACAAEQALTSRRQHRDLQEVAKYRRNLFDQLGDGVLLLDRSYRVLDANPCALDMLGHAGADLPNLRLHDLIAEDDRQRLRALTPAQLGAASPLAEWWALRRDGSRFPVEVSVRPVDGQRYVAVLRDVSVRHAQEQQLRELSVAVDQSSSGVVITDLQGRIQYVNAATLSISGYARDELIGRQPQLLQSGLTPSATLREMTAQLGAGRPWKGLLFNRSKAGIDYTAFATVTPIRQPSAEITQFLAVFEDVTEKRRMGEELDRYRHHLEELVEQRTAELDRARQAAEAATEAKGAFLATMSHEIRTPMNGVVGIVDVLRQSSLTPYQDELATTIRESSVALLGIIDDILDFSKVEAGALRLSREPVDLLRLIEGVCDTLQPLASSRGVALQAFVDPALPGWIHSDALRLRQIITNLLGNAIKFSAGLERPGRVRLRCEAAGAGQMRLQVSDNGIGVASAAQDQIFEPFVQGDSTTARRYGGTGLGLSICRRLVDLFGGRIEVTQAAGPGATFTVSMPIHPDPAPAPRSPDLSGVHCHICLRDRAQAQDWCAYLMSAGATAQAWPTLVELRHALAADPQRRAVLLVESDIETGPDGDGHDQMWWPPGAAGQPLPLVRIGRGQRRHARLIDPGRVSLDADVMHRGALLQAVALAVGQRKAAPLVETLITPDSGPPPPPSLERASRHGRVVLVAEDNEINQTVIRHQLALMGFAAEIVDDGEAALATWRAARAAGRYGLLLTDLNMPGLDGYALAEAIRRDEAASADGSRLPIVALTANAVDAETERCLASGMDDYLCKPVELTHLGEVVTRWLPPEPEDESIGASTIAALLDDAQMPEFEAPAPAGSRAEAQVLLVDDETTELLVLERQLQALGAPPVKSCRSAKGALQWLQSRDTSAMLLLLDLNMPGMDGVEFMRHLADRRFAGAVALVSAADVRVLETATKLARAYQLNVLSHLQKPVPNDTLRSLMERWRGFVPARSSARSRTRDADEIRQAIANHELLLHYQPKVSLATGEWLGVEALVRWQHPRDGLCYPDSFIEAAEAHDLIDALTRTVLTQAMAQLRRWRERGMDLKMAVNVSMDNLARLDFPEFVLAEAARHHVPPTELVLEVTESRLMRDARSAMDILTRLRLKRIGLSIDDFGTGHSSLAQLRDIPFGELKIDRGFVHGSREQPTQRAIFRASVDMAHQLGMSTVAEGVEDRADWDFVRAAGCDVAQGYFIARPMPASALGEWATQWRERFEAL